MGDSLEKVYEEHRNIIKAVEAHDQGAACDAIRAHLESIRVDLMDR